MRIFFDNVSFSSNSGPNQFGLKLAKEFSKKGHILVDAHELPDVQLSFIQAINHAAPIVQRLDGIWFNSAQDWNAQNRSIFDTYKIAKHVIVQSNFDRLLIEKFFGKHENVSVIRNGTDVKLIDSINPMHVPTLQNVNKVWTCAASWRPHKRLAENIRYFMEHAAKDDVLVIAGENPDVAVADPRIFYAGNLDYETLISLYKASDYFIHLAWLDHCPNVVVDARAAGCHIICSSSGGTSEIAGENSTIIQEDEWDFMPCKLYEPPKMDFSRKIINSNVCSIDIIDVARQYEVVLAGA